jgi:putative ABC transport system permease protein
MIRNYLKTAWRNLMKHKIFSLVNVTGLTIGLACSMFIMLWVGNEWNYDRYHARLPQIYAVMENQFYSGGNIFTTGATPGPLAPKLGADIPGIRKAARFSWRMEKVFTAGEKKFREEGFYADNEALDIFSFPLLAGQAAGALKPGSIVINRKLAEKYFGSIAAAPGKTIRLDNEKDYLVTAVIENIPVNSSLQFDYLLPMEDLIARFDWLKGWGSNSLNCYVLLDEKADPETVGRNIKNIVKQQQKESTTELFLYPLSKMHLYGSFSNGKPDGGGITYVRLFMIIAAFVLLIACINFMNLSTARAVIRSKEVGIRKSIGASKRSLLVQFIGESFLLSAIAIVLAVVIVRLLLSPFETLINTDIALQYLNIRTLLFLAGLLALTGLAAGAYPAFYLSSFEPVITLKGGIVRTKMSVLAVRKGLVIFQFVISTVLICGAIFVYQQIEFIKHRKLGITKENIVYMYKEGPLEKNYDVFKQYLSAQPGINSITGANQLPIRVGNSTFGVKWAGMKDKENILFATLRVDYDFERAMNVTIKEGRGFSRNFGADSTSSVIINETAARAMQLKDPVGKTVSFQDGDHPATIIGVVKDFHSNSMRAQIDPLIITLSPGEAYHVLVHIDPAKINTALSSMEKAWERFNPSFPFSYHFMSEDFDRMYRSEQMIGRLAAAFTVLAIIIACLGLFGLSTFTAQQRTREIGIRKVLGASIGSIVTLLSKEFLILIFIAIIIAAPLAGYFMHNWLQNFAYHVNLSAWVFVITGCLALVVALLTVSIQTVKAAMMNPIKSLRTE